MPEEPNILPSSRLARWLLLLILVAGGVVLYFRNGTHLPAFGSVESSADTSR